jgi:hypothetical protein
MNDQNDLSEEELAVLIELLEHEERELPTEIRHTRLAKFRDGLHHKLDVVRGLLDRFRGPATASRGM